MLNMQTKDVRLHAFIIVSLTTGKGIGIKAFRIHSWKRKPSSTSVCVCIPTQNHSDQFDGNRRVLGTGNRRKRGFVYSFLYKLKDQPCICAGRSLPIKVLQIGTNEVYGW